MKLNFFPRSVVHVSEGLLCIDFHTSAILNLTTTQRSNSPYLIYRGANRPERRSGLPTVTKQVVLESELSGFHPRPQAFNLT